MSYLTFALAYCSYLGMSSDVGTTLVAAMSAGNFVGRIMAGQVAILPKQNANEVSNAWFYHTQSYWRPYRSFERKHHFYTSKWNQFAGNMDPCLYVRHSHGILRRFWPLLLFLCNLL